MCIGFRPIDPIASVHPTHFKTKDRRVLLSSTTNTPKRLGAIYNIGKTIFQTYINQNYKPYIFL
ncbi:hypothetical protein HanRHA438_Chr15g0700381 [Helianthus annuus]|nr:hypothetical protein HanIR_Chr15g0747691 [Helianthus annuus]KAJ0844255.1 hypothetical protein HanRHA438_Chr15g0700381 [Helianthus annuus]